MEKKSHQAGGMETGAFYFGVKNAKISKLANYCFVTYRLYYFLETIKSLNAVVVFAGSLRLENTTQKILFN